VRLLREERVLTAVLMQWIAPLSIFALVACFRWVFMIFIPIFEENQCWIYYLTRAPY